MLGIVSRLTDQKGLDLVDYVIEEICSEDTQFVILGTGDPKYENLFRHYEWKYHGQGFCKYLLLIMNVLTEIYAACDAFLNAVII